MPVLPLQGMVSETANRFEVDVLRVDDIDEESGVLRPVRNSKLLSGSVPPNTQSLVYLPNGGSETDYVLLDTPYSTRWNRYVLDTRVVSGNVQWRAHTLSGSSTLTAEYQSLPTPTLLRVGSTQTNRTLVNTTGSEHKTIIGSNTYTGTFTSSLVVSITGAAPSSDTTAETQIPLAQLTDLSEYASIVIPKLSIRGVSGHTFENIYFTLATSTGETIVPILSWSSRRIEPLRINQTQAPYANIEFRDLELDISGVVRNSVSMLKIYWLVIGGASPAPPNWTVELTFDAETTGSSILPAIPLCGMFQSGAYAIVSAIRQKDTRAEFRDLINQSANSNVMAQVIGPPRKYFSMNATVRLPHAFVLNLALNPPPSTSSYELVLGQSTGNSWQEIATATVYLPHAVSQAGFGTAANVAVDLLVPNTSTPYDYRTRHTPLENAYCLVVSGSQYEIVEVRKDTASANINRFIITRRGLESTTAQSFPANTQFYFLDVQFRLNRVKTARGWTSGGELPFGPIGTAYDRIVCADVNRNWLRFSTKNHPILFPTTALVAGDGFAQPMADIIYDMALEGGNLIAHGKQNVYSIVVPDRQTQTMPIAVAAPKSRNHQCISYNYVLTSEGVTTRDGVVFPADYRDMTKRAKILFTGSRLYWYYGNRIYWTDPNEKGVYRHVLPNVQEILDIDVYEEDAVVLVRRSDNSQLEVRRLRAGNGRIINGSIEYGWIGESKRAQIGRIHVWGRDLDVVFITPQGSTTRSLDYDGLLTIDVHAPNRKLTQDFQLKVVFKTAQSYLERLLVEPIVSAFPQSANT